MEFIGTLATEGAPVCIAPAELAREWDGLDGDYWDMMQDEPEELVTTFVNRLGNRYGFFHTETGHFAVFATRHEFVLFELHREGDEPFDFGSSDFDLDRMAVEPGVLKLGGLGGRVALFDSVLSGLDLQLEHTGCSRARGRHETPWTDEPDTALIEIEPGVWTVSVFAYQEDDLVLRGAWFEHQGGLAP